jgi:hypothetical protein
MHMMLATAVEAGAAFTWPLTAGLAVVIVAVPASSKLSMDA